VTSLEHPTKPLARLVASFLGGPPDINNILFVAFPVFEEREREKEREGRKKKK
jgi:hypothetical protein